MKFAFTFRPKLIDSLKSYRSADFLADLTAGVTVGLVALPLAMALAIASGLKPEVGIFTAVIAGFLISVLGGSRVQIGGPAGAFIPILVPIVVAHGHDGLLVCAVMAGVILFGMGVTGLGSLIKFIPYPVVTGFTSGIAVIILSTQLGDFLGLGIKLPPDFVAKLSVLSKSFSPNWPTVVMALTCVGLIGLWPQRFGRRVPGSIVAIVLGAVVVALFDLEHRFGIRTIGSEFGGIPSALPRPHWPDFSHWRALLPDAFTIAVLGALESLLCAVVADGMIDDRHDSNQELMAQGIANVAAGLFGGMSATGVLARTATNVRSGARSPVAGILHAATLLLILLLAAPLAKFVPMAALASVLVVVAWRMGEWHQFTRLRRWPQSDAVVFVATFGLTIFTDLTKAVGVGMIMAAALFLKRVSETTQITAVDETTETEGPHHSLVGKEIPEGVLVYRIFGAFFFGAADKLETALKRAQQQPKVLILRMRKVLAVDATGLNALEDLYEKLEKKGKHLILSGPRTQPLVAMEQAGFIERLGRENVCPHVDAALARAREILHLPPGKGGAATNISGEKGLETA